MYNARTNSFAEIDKSIYDSLNTIKQDPQKIKDLLSKDDYDTLVKAKIIVNKEEDEHYFLEKKMQYYVENFNRSIIGLVIAPTNDCNFDCVYCFEAHKTPTYMNTTTEDQIVEFIKKHEEAKYIQITWYGGEPLMGFRTMRNLYEKIKNIEGKEIIEHSIVTNGYLLNESKYDFFRSNPLTHIQITFDGLAETHNKRRLHKNGKPTYDKIIENLDKFIEAFPDIRMSVRIHVEEGNKNEFIIAYRAFKERWKVYKNVNMYPGFITENVGDNLSSRPSDCSSLTRKSLSDFYFSLYKEHGCYVRFYPNLRSSRGCSATRINSYVIGADGALYKCWNDIGVERKIVGYIDNDTIPNPEILSMYTVGCSMFDNEECKSCSIFPICTGGCQFQRINNSEGVGKYDLCNARKDNLEEYLELHYEQRLQST